MEIQGKQAAHSADDKDESKALHLVKNGGGSDLEIRGSQLTSAGDQNRVTEDLEVVTMATREDWDKLLNTKKRASSQAASAGDAWRTIDKQICAFEDLVDQMNTKCASLEAHHSALLHVTNCPFGTPRRVKGPPTTPPENESDIASVRQLREALQKLRKRAGKTGRDMRAIADIDGLLKDLQFMRSLKRYFDEKVYCVLYRFFYDPFVVILSDPDALSSSNPGSKVIMGLDNGGSASEKVDDGSSSVFLTEVVAGDTKATQLRYLDKLQESVNDLYAINQRWDALCTMDDLSLTNFESESSVRTAQFEEKQHFEAVFRMLPDLLCKCRKCIEIAKDWLQQYRDLYSGTEVEDSEPIVDWKTTPFDLQKKINDIQEMIIRRSSNVRHLEHALDIHSKDLEFLESKEHRVRDLMNSCDKIAAHRTVVGERYKGMIRRRQECVHALENTIQGTQRYKDFSSELRQLEMDICEQCKELKLAEYGMEIAQSDCELEAEVATNFVIFSQTEREKITKIKHDLDQLRRVKRQLCEQSDQVKSNHAKMMEILTLKLGPGLNGIRPIEPSNRTGSTVVVANNNNNKAVVQSGVSGGDARPTTNATYSIDKVSDRDRYSDKDEGSDVTLSEDEQGAGSPLAMVASKHQPQDGGGQTVPVTSRTQRGGATTSDPLQKPVLVNHNRQT